MVNVIFFFFGIGPYVSNVMYGRGLGPSNNNHQEIKVVKFREKI